MVFKINISDKKGKSWKLEIESETIIGKKIGDKINGSEISPDLAGYELEITGGSDLSGFPHKKDAEGPHLRGVLLTKGWGMHKKPKREGKKPVQTSRGLRLKKSVRGKEISEKTSQINMILVKEGNKKLKEIFSEQNKSAEPVQAKESVKEEIKEEIKKEVKEEIKGDIPSSPETKTARDKEKAAEEIAEEVAEESEEIAEDIAEEEK